jgi:hypothetical protein
MAHHLGPRVARPACKLRVGHPVGFAIILKVKRWRHLDGPHSRAMTRCWFGCGQLVNLKNLAGFVEAETGGARAHAGGNTKTKIAEEIGLDPGAREEFLVHPVIVEA